MPPFSIAAIMMASMVSAINSQAVMVHENISYSLKNSQKGVNNMRNLFSPEVPVLLIGAPGIGKTAGVHAHFDYVEVMLASTLVEEDIAGLPYREGSYDYRTIPAMFRRLAEADTQGKTTALFADEIDKARRSVADTLLTLFVSRGVGEAFLPEKTCIIAAANPPEFGGGDGISEAMQSRFATIDYEPDVAGWCNWASSQFTNTQTRSVINAIRNGEMPIFDMTGEGLNKRVSSPRTITMALRAIERHGAGSETFEILSRGLLTPAVASQVLHLARHQNNDVMAKATESAKRSLVNKSTIQPVRL